MLMACFDRTWSRMQFMAVPDLLRPEEERLVEARSHMECITVLPILSVTLRSMQDVLGAFQASEPLPWLSGDPHSIRVWKFRICCPCHAIASAKTQNVLVPNC